MKKLLFSIIALLALIAGCTCQDVTNESTKEAQNAAVTSSEVTGPPVVDFFIPRPPSIIPGEYSVLMWNVSGATSVKIDQGIGDVRHTGRAAVSPKTTTVYTLTATNLYGSDTTRTRVIVMAGSEVSPEKPVIIKFVASPAMISPGQSVTLTWSVSNAATVTPSWKKGTVSFVGHEVVSPLTSTNYTITASNQAGSTQATVDVTVSQVTPAADLPVINSFKADPVNIGAGQSTILSWNVSNANTVTPSWKKGTVPAKGHEVVSPLTSAEYTLTATNQVGSAKATVNVTVSQGQPAVGLPVINFFKAEPVSINTGQSTTLSWNVSNVTTVTPSWKKGTIPAIGHEVVSPEVSTQYILTATNQNGSTQAEVAVVVAFQGPPVPTKTITIPLVYEESGIVTSTGDALLASNTFMSVGDNFVKIAWQAFLSFDISDIPVGAAIKDVIVDFSDYHQIVGNPFVDLGCLRGYVHDYGMPDTGDFFVGIPMGAIIRYCSAAEIVLENNTDVRDALKAKVGAKRFKIRLQFATKTDNDDDTDMISWSKWHYPKMTVTYYLPLQ